MSPRVLFQKMLSSMRRDGLTAATSKTISGLREPWFDILHGTDTGGRVGIEDIDASGPNVIHGLDYEATSHHELRTLFARLHLRDAGGVFVDFGCGKGRVILLATTYPFERIVGVEFSQRMCETARSNVARYNPSASDRVEILNEDASLYELRDDETVFFLFNPFEEAVMSKVLENIYRSLRRRNRPVLLIYSNPRCRSLIESGGIFLKVAEHRFPRTTAFVYTNAGTDRSAIRG